jgi:hypothetical protein
MRLPRLVLEKPFTLSAEEAERIVRRANERGVKVCAGHQVLFEGPASRLASTRADRPPRARREPFRFAWSAAHHAGRPGHILPRGYLVVEHLRAGTGITDASIEIPGASVDAVGETMHYCGSATSPLCCS